MHTCIATWVSIYSRTMSSTLAGSLVVSASLNSQYNWVSPWYPTTTCVPVTSPIKRSHYWRTYSHFLLWILLCTCFAATILENDMYNWVWLYLCLSYYSLLEHEQMASFSCRHVCLPWNVKRNSNCTWISVIWHLFLSSLQCRRARWAGSELGAHRTLLFWRRKVFGAPT